MTSPSPLTILQVDAFTAQPFKGNPAAVCVLPDAAEEGWMQSVADEMNLSETAFLYPIEDGFHLRWFTPAAEVDLCGHATLASAHVLWSEGHLAADQVARFHTKSGLLTAQCLGDWIELNFPAMATEKLIPPPELSKALRGVEAQFVGRSGKNYLVEVASEAVVRALIPDFALMKTLDQQGVIVTSRAETEGVDFVSRYFAPAVGINEDPVTGSAHCTLAPYWEAILGQSEFLAHQVSRRGGVLKVRCNSDRVALSGQAVTVFKGSLMVAPPA